MKLIFKGVVQGVGFRPTIYRIAKDMGLNGYVLNKGSEVEVVIDRDKNEFIKRVKKNLPSIAEISDIKIEQDEGTYKGFKIINVGTSGQLGAYVFKMVLAEGQIFEDIEIIGYCQHGFVLNYGNTAIADGPKIRNCSLSHLTNHIEIGNSTTVTEYIDNIEISDCEFFDPHSQLVSGDHMWNTGDNFVLRNVLIFNNRFYGDWGGSDSATLNTAQIYLEGDSVYSAKIYNNHHTFSNTTAGREDYIF